MASRFRAPTRTSPRAAAIPHHRTNRALLLAVEPPELVKLTRGSRVRAAHRWRIRVSNGGDNSYLDMWKNAVDRERKTTEFQKLVETSAESGTDGVGEEEESPEVIARKSSEFQKILEAPAEERDRIQRMQIIDRAAAAISAARALLKESSSPSVTAVSGVQEAEVGGDLGDQQGGMQSGNSFVSPSGTVQNVTPGPDFWSWTPPDSGRGPDDESNLNLAAKISSDTAKTNPVMEIERSLDFLSIPFETKLVEGNQNPLLPPLQSLMEVQEVESSKSVPVTSYLEEKRELGVVFSENAAEAAHALHEVDGTLKEGVNPDGTRWWREQGTERRPDGVLCKWTLTRGVSADKAVEWEDKYWEASDPFGYKELGSEKSGRDVAGNVWREFWRESMWQEHGLVQFEKTADKWGKNGNGGEWQENWWERYDASGQAEKSAHKWCSIDPLTYLEAGHAHVWHERWGETYDGQGGSTKYTDKWAERLEGDGWSKWGDKWDEHFDQSGCGVKQGETWWQGKHGECWNRTWGEGHNGSGWVHKYGKSSSGEHWDTHEGQETWYEKYPHFGFQHCFENSVQLREVQEPSDTS